METLLNTPGLEMFTSHTPSLSKLWEHFLNKGAKGERKSSEPGHRGEPQRRSVHLGAGAAQGPQEKIPLDISPGGQNSRYHRKTKSRKKRWWGCGR